ncbi:peroxidasin homolog isoform X1 [Pelobates cultripes]|uniref:Peroxidasin homolog isoform X1 n=1 Tax=Pelobates cultripes TaxID=61616 RepID=A0AAD1VJ48_PELCU|nr:peroxidasin homolog isoform X1 [Pelobates cultripes]
MWRIWTCVLLSWMFLANGVNAKRVISVAVGSQVILPMEVTLYRNLMKRFTCDQFEWFYKNQSSSTRLGFNIKCGEAVKPPARMRISENGSLEIANVTTEDSGKYTVRVNSGSDGKLSHSKNFTLSVQVPVSDPILDVSCHMNGSAVISCQVQNGSDPEYSLSVNGEMPVIINSSVISIIEPSSAPWNINCSVRNRISRRESNLTAKNCPVPVSVPSLNVTCHTNGSVEIICSVQKGSDPVFSWILDGKIKNVDSNLSESAIILPAGTFGNITCTVNNSISQESNVTSITCPVPVSDPVLDVSCQMNGIAVISCRVQNGSDPEYSLSVNGDMRVKSSHSVSVSGVNITESSPPPWNISCIVNNSISHRESSMQARKCPVRVSDPVMNVSCQVNGSAVISCQVQNGSDPEYSLSVNGDMRVKSSHSVSGVTITESSPPPWNISCVVNNTISHTESSLQARKCPGLVSLSVPVSGPVRLYPEFQSLFLTQFQCRILLYPELQALFLSQFQCRILSVYTLNSSPCFSLSSSVGSCPVIS